MLHSQRNKEAERRTFYFMFLTAVTALALCACAVEAQAPSTPEASENTTNSESQESSPYQADPEDAGADTGETALIHDECFDLGGMATNEQLLIWLIAAFKRELFASDDQVTDFKNEVLFKGVVYEVTGVSVPKPLIDALDEEEANPTGEKITACTMVISE